jgi:hypothetical protein
MDRRTARRQGCRTDRAEELNSVARMEPTGRANARPMINSAQSGKSRSVRQSSPDSASLHPGYEVDWMASPGPAAIKPYPLRNCGSLRPKFSPNNLAWTYLISSFVGMHMTNRMGNSGTAILIGALATVTLVVAMNGMAQAADTCLSGPKGAAPKGSHWYYRIDHATKRNCWYVRAEGDKPVASQNSPLSQTSPQAETPLQPSVANARAEAGPADLGQSNERAVDRAPSGAANDGQASDAPAADNGQSTVASRWLDQAGTDAITGSTPKPDDSGASVNSPAPSAAVAPLAAANARPASSAGSVPTLLLVIVGALALAALLAGVVLRFSNARRNDRQDFDGGRPAPWDSIDVGATIRSPPLATETPAPQSSAARERHEAVIPDEIVQLLSRLSKEAAA